MTNSATSVMTAPATTEVVQGATSNPANNINATSQNAAAAAPADTGKASPWYSGIKDEAMRGLAELKGWDTPEKAIESYRNLEKLVGRDKLVKPKDLGDTDAWNALKEFMGVPKEVAGYKFELPDQANKEFVGKATEWFHKAGIGQNQASEIVKEYLAYESAMVQQQEQAAAVQSENDMKALQQEWGQAYDEKIHGAREAARLVGLKQEDLSKIESAIGTKAMLQLFSTFGEKLGESKTIGFDGKEANGKMTPAGAKARLDELTQDKAWVAKILNNDVAAKAERERLLKMAFPE